MIILERRGLRNKLWLFGLCQETLDSRVSEGGDGDAGLSEAVVSNM